MPIHALISVASVPPPAPVPIRTSPARRTSPSRATSRELWTPADYVAKVCAVLGGIHLDPFSCAGANATVGARRFFAKGDGPFRRPWDAETAFIHPPCELRTLNRCANKFLKEWSYCNIKRAIILVDLSSPGYCYDLLRERADAVCVTDQPILFITPSGRIQTSGARQALLYFGDDPVLFSDQFSNVGKVTIDKKPTPIPPKKRARRSKPQKPSASKRRVAQPRQATAANQNRNRGDAALHRRDRRPK